QWLLAVRAPHSPAFPVPSGVRRGLPRREAVPGARAVRRPESAALRASFRSPPALTVPLSRPASASKDYRLLLSAANSDARTLRAGRRSLLGAAVSFSVPRAPVAWQRIVAPLPREICAPAYTRDSARPPAPPPRVQASRRPCMRSERALARRTAETRLRASL